MFPVPSAATRTLFPRSILFSIDIARDDGQRRGIRQGSIPIREGLEYRGYVWLKTADYAGTITVALEADETSGERYANAAAHQYQR